jgi:hypothetical protein
LRRDAHGAERRMKSGTMDQGSGIRDQWLGVGDQDRRLRTSLAKHISLLFEERCPRGREENEIRD